MEVYSLKLHVTEADLNALASRFLDDDTPLEEVRMEVKPEGLCVRGVYPLLVNVSFESWWKVGVIGGKVAAKMTKLKAFGMPAMIFKSAVLKALHEISAKEFWFEVKGEDVHLDVEYLVARYACHAKIHLKSVTCGEGELFVEAGKA